MKILTAALSLATLLFLAANASAEATSGFAHGYVWQPYYSPGAALLLDSFYFRYSDEDHHVESLAAKLEPDGYITLALKDQNDDDEYFYSVEHTPRADDGIITGSFVDFCNGSCLYPLTSPGAGYVFALSSFRFYYRGDDHHMDQIGILLESDGVRTYFNDQNDDDPYVVYVDYAWLPPSMVEQTGQLTGTDDGGGVQTELPNANRSIISGFLVDYLYGGDHHVREIGVLTRTSDVQIYYGDKNGDDDFSYVVDYAILY